MAEAEGASMGTNGYTICRSFATTSCSCFFWGIPSTSKWRKRHTSGRTTFQEADH
jgi:hypothetical protein